MNAQTGTAADEPFASHISNCGLDRRITVTFFPDMYASSKRQEAYSLRSLAERIRALTASSKAKLPWLKLARFGDVAADSGCLRHDGNLLAITGIEADYDGGIIPFADAVEILLKADVLALAYTSPGHTEDALRWRVLCPTSTEMLPAQREKMLGRLNGLFHGIFSGESWTLSQSYYFGSVASNPSHQVELVDGAPIDLLDDLDASWQGKPNTTGSRPGTSGEGPKHGRVNETKLLEEIVSGKSYHAASVRLLGKWAREGVPYMDARARLMAAMETVFPLDRDARWQARYDDVDRCLDGIYVKECPASGPMRQLRRVEKWRISGSS